VVEGKEHVVALVHNGGQGQLDLVEEGGRVVVIQDRGRDGGELFLASARPVDNGERGGRQRQAVGAAGLVAVEKSDAASVVAVAADQARRQAGAQRVHVVVVAKSRVAGEILPTAPPVR
jgi:hypothetical protein